MNNILSNKNDFSTLGFLVSTFNEQTEILKYNENYLTIINLFKRLKTFLLEKKKTITIFSKEKKSLKEFNLVYPFKYENSAQFIAFEKDFQNLITNNIEHVIDLNYFICNIEISNTIFVIITLSI